MICVSETPKSNETDDRDYTVRYSGTIVVILGRAVQLLGGGHDNSVPGEITKTAPSVIKLHDPLHGRQACPEFNLFYYGVGQICPREGLLSCRPLPKWGQFCDIPPYPPNR